MLCYVMLCYVMLCYVMLCYVMLCCYVVMLLCCYVMLCYVMLCSFVTVYWYDVYLYSWTFAHNQNFTYSSILHGYTVLMKLYPCGRYRQLNSVL